MQWLHHFSGLQTLSAPIQESLTERAQTASIPQGSYLFGPGQAPNALVLLIEGCIRVQKVGENGREITLYRVHAGESCVLTTACLLAYEDYTAEAIAETDLEVVLIPKNVFDQLMAESRDFRSFVFQAFSNRVTDLFQIIDAVAFQRLDIRMAGYLLERSKEMETDSLSITHQQLASELGSAREVISRQLQDFKRREWLTTTRGQITLLNKDALSALAKINA